jgi:hypothetical protein
MLEEQIEYLKKHDKEIVEEVIEDENLSFNTPEWHELVNQHEQKAHIDIPRFFRNPFLVSLYSILESGVLEIAQNIQMKKGIEVSLKEVDVRTFLDQAKKYYKDELNFTLYTENKNWQNIKALSDFRNAIAHSNGRLEPLNDSLRNKLYKYSKSGFEIFFTAEYFIVEKELADRLLKSVVKTLRSLVDSYKNWEDSYKKDG